MIMLDRKGGIKTFPDRDNFTRPDTKVNPQQDTKRRHRRKHQPGSGIEQGRPPQCSAGEYDGIFSCF